MLVKFKCARCKKTAERERCHLNRQRKIGAPIYCGKRCFGLTRRLGKTKAQKKEEKRIYDMKFRAKNLERLKKEKAAYYQRTHDPVKEAKIRKKRMHLHVKYCQQPEYRAWKKKYDRAYLCKQRFGPFWEAASILIDLDKEVESRISRYEIYQQNGTLNKWLQRRRNYDQIVGTISRKSQRRALGYINTDQGRQDAARAG